MKFDTLLFATLITIFAFCAISCSRGRDDSAAAIIIAERDSLRTLATENQRELERMTEFFNGVAACIDSISEQENLLAVAVDPETHRRYSSREMAARLEQLSDIINDQRQRIQTLLDSLHNSTDSVRINGLTSTIAFLTAQLDQKEAQIERLRAELNGERRNVRRLSQQVENLEGTVDTLTRMNTVLHEAVQVQNEIINEGFILMADKSILQHMGVIEGGGFLRRSKVNLGNVDIGKCTKVDVSQFTEITISAKKVKILSPAPQESYRLTKSGDVHILTITDPAAFWSLSNILVIQTQQ